MAAHRKVSFRDAFKTAKNADSGNIGSSFRLSDQKLASLRELIKQQQSATADSRSFVDCSEPYFRSAVSSDIPSNHDIYQSNLSTRRLHHAADPIIPMADTMGNVYSAESECISPVRSRKVARKIPGSDEEENLPAPATPLLPGKIRVESLKQKTKAKDAVKAVDKSKHKPELFQRAFTLPAKEIKKAPGQSILATSAPISAENDGVKPPKASSSKRVRNEEDIKSFKKGLEVAWQVIGPPPIVHPTKKKSPEKEPVEQKVRRKAPLDTGLRKSVSAKPTAGLQASNDGASPMGKKSASEIDLDKSAEVPEESHAVNLENIEENRLPSVAQSIMQDLKKALKDDESKAAAKPKVTALKSKPSEKDKKDKEPIIPKKARPNADRDAIQNYIKQQRMARHSAEMQRKAEQARLEREKQARLQALIQQQQQLASVPVRQLLPEGFQIAPRVSLKVPSYSNLEDDQMSTSSESTKISQPVKSSAEKVSPMEVYPEPNSTVATIANALVPEAARTRRVCAILESALSLQVKLRAEVDRVERFISGRSSQQTDVKTPASVAKFEAASMTQRRSPSLLHELSGFSEEPSNLQVPPVHPQVRDSSCSPIFRSPESRDRVSPRGVGHDRTLTPESPNARQGRIRTPNSGVPSLMESSTSPLSTGLNIQAADSSFISRQSSAISSGVLPLKKDPWNVASVLRRSFGIGTTPSRDNIRPRYADAELQTTILESESPEKDTAEVAVQSATVFEEKEDTNRLDVAEACIQTQTSPIKSVVEDVMSDEASMLSFHKIPSPSQRQLPENSRIAAILRQEAEVERVPAEVLDAQLHAELDLLASLDGYHRQLDDLERQRTTGERNTDVAGLVSLMNAVETHVKLTMGGRSLASSPPSRPRSASSKKVRESPPKKQPIQQVVVQQQIEPAIQSSVTALEMRQDIERRFQALEAATGRRLAEDSERLLEAHLRTSIAVSDLTRQLADMQRQSLIGLEERQSQFRSTSTQPPPPPPTEGPVRYHRRQTFSPPRPPPQAPSRIVPEEDFSSRPIQRNTLSTVTVSEAPPTVKSASSTTKSVAEDDEEVSQVSSATENEESSVMESPKVQNKSILNQSLSRREEDHRLLCELIAQQARESTLRFRKDIAQLTLREREAKKQANAELKLIDKQKLALNPEKPEDKLALDKLTKLRATVLASYAREKQHLENLKKSSARLASEQKSLADQLRQSLPAAMNASMGDLSVADASLGLSESVLSDGGVGGHDLTLQLMQLQIEQLSGSAPGAADALSKTAIEQLLTGREQLLEERQSIAQQMLMRKAQLDAKETEIRRLEEKLARELATPGSKPRPLASSLKPDVVITPKQPQTLVVPTLKAPKAPSLAAATDDDVASLPESIDNKAPTTPGSTTAPPIPSSSMAGLGEILALEKLQRKPIEESVAEAISTARSTTPAATVVSEEVTEQPKEDYSDDDFEQSAASKSAQSVPSSVQSEKSAEAKSIKSQSSAIQSVKSVSSVVKVDVKKVETMTDELDMKRQQVRELKQARDEIKRKREAEKVRAKEAHLASKLAQKDEEIRELEQEIAVLQAVSEQSLRSESKASQRSESSTSTRAPSLKELRRSAEPKSETHKSITEDVASEIEESSLKKSISRESLSSKKEVVDYQEESFFSEKSDSLEIKSEVQRSVAANSTSSKSSESPVIEKQGEIYVASEKSKSLSVQKSSGESKPKEPEYVSALKTASEISEDVVESEPKSLPKKELEFELRPASAAKSMSEATEAEESIQLDTEEPFLESSVNKSNLVYSKDEDDDDDFFVQEVRIPQLEPEATPVVAMKKISEHSEPAPERPISRLSDRSKHDQVAESEGDVSESIQKSVSEPVKEAEAEDVENVKQSSSEELESPKEMSSEKRGLELEEPEYSESFSEAQSSSRRLTVSSTKDFEAAAEELSESIASAEEEPEGEDEEDSSLSGQFGQTVNFLDLGATLGFPDSSAKKTPAALLPEQTKTPNALPPALDSTYTVSSTTGETPIAQKMADLESPDTTPKVARSKDSLADTLSGEFFSNFVKEAVDDAVYVVKTSPKKLQARRLSEEETTPTKAPLPSDSDLGKVDLEEDDTFAKVAEVASRLRSMAGVGKSAESPTPPPPPEPLVPFLSVRRQQVPQLVRGCVDYLWQEKLAGRSIEDLDMPDGLDMPKASPTQPLEITQAESQFARLVFDTTKMIFGDLFAKGKIVPTCAEDAYRAVARQISPIVGLSPANAAIPTRVQFATVGRRRDAVDEVLLAELYQEPNDAWCDFTADEEAVREEVLSSIMSGLVDDLMLSIEPLLSKKR